jgi:hypothetical protein
MSNRSETMGERAAVRRWTHAGLDCAMIDSEIGFINGYVRLPDEHVARHAGYDQINRSIRVHGGLTYGTDRDGWVGFDTGHSGDHGPSLPTKSHLGPAERTWDLDRLAAEVESLADQLAAMTEIAEPESSWDCTEDEFQAILPRREGVARTAGGGPMKLYRGDMPGGQVLLTIHDDDTAEIAFRPDQWATWDEPVMLTEATS